LLLKRLKIKLQGDLLGLDLGMAKTGVARLHVQAGIAEPLADILMQEDWISQVQEAVRRHESEVVVVGVPRSMSGKVTEQTKWALARKTELEQALNVPIFEIDEAATTKIAEQKVLDGQSVDGVAAGILLEDFLAQVKRGSIDGVSV
jgi:putative Holliday junction resolvase